MVHYSSLLTCIMSQSNPKYTDLWPSVQDFASSIFCVSLVMSTNSSSSKLDRPASIVLFSRSLFSDFPRSFVVASISLWDWISRFSGVSKLCAVSAKFGPSSTVFSLDFVSVWTDWTETPVSSVMLLLTSSSVFLIGSGTVSSILLLLSSYASLLSIGSESVISILSFWTAFACFSSSFCTVSASAVSSDGVSPFSLLIIASLGSSMLTVLYSTANVQA